MNFKNGGGDDGGKRTKAQVGHIALSLATMAHAQAGQVPPAGNSSTFNPLNLRGSVSHASSGGFVFGLKCVLRMSWLNSYTDASLVAIRLNHGLPQTSSCIRHAILSLCSRTSYI